MLTHPRLPIVVALLALLLTLPSITAGFWFDDYFHKLVLEGHENRLQMSRAPLDLFRFFDGNPEHTRKVVDLGVMPWWTDDEIKAGFWRPLSSLTHWADYRLWPDSPPLMHLQSILWYVLLVIAAGCLYRRMMGSASAAAGLALILYCVDDAHATPAIFLANRNSLPAAIFGILALLAHDRWRRGTCVPRAGASVSSRADMPMRTSALRVVGPLMLLVSLLFKEEGIATFAYLLAYALLLDEGSVRKRLSTLAPYVAVIAVWRIVYVHLGYGVAHIGFYTDPIHDPLRFGHYLIPLALLMLMAQFSGVPAAIALLVKPAWVLAGAVAFLALMMLVLWPVFRRSRVARFWAVGTLLSVIPLCTTFPDDRMLIFPGIGAMALVAMLITEAFSGRVKGWFRPGAVALAGLLIVIHLLIAPSVLMWRSCGAVPARRVVNHLSLPHPLDPGVEKQDLVVVNPPVHFFMMTSLLEMASRGEPLPRRTRALAPSLIQPVYAHRRDANTLVVAPEWGYGASPDEQLTRDYARPLKLGDAFRVTGMTARVTGMTPDGRPAEVAFRFAVPLEDRSLRWLQWKDNHFVPFHPPKVGESLTLPGPPGGIRGLLKR